MFVVHIKLALGISFPKNATESFGKLFFSWFVLSDLPTELID